MFDDLYEFNVGDIVTVDLTQYGQFDHNVWKITKHLIGGYVVENLVTKDEIWPNYFDCTKWEPDLGNIPYHVGHEVVISYVSNPKYDAYYYCRDCKEEVKPLELYAKLSEARFNIEDDDEWEYPTMGSPVVTDDDEDDFGYAVLLGED